MIATIAPLLAGLGLFFSGVHFISANLTLLVGKRLRLMLTRATAFPSLGALMGILAGIVLQSTNAVTLVIIGLISTGVIEKRKAMPVAIWSHVGTSLLVILVAVDLRIGASYVVALAGFSMYFGIKHGDRIRPLTTVLLGVGLLFLGIQMLKSGAEPLRDYLVGEGVVTAAAHNPLILFALGAGLTVLSQSSTVTGAIAVTTANISLIDFNGACLMVYGANLGTAINFLFLARGLNSDARQIALLQATQRFSGLLVVIVLTLVEWWLGQDFLGRVTALLSGNVAGQVAWIFLLSQIAGSTVCTMWFGHLARWLERLAPVSNIELLSKPIYLSNEALFEPSFALDLVIREERRLMERLPTMLDGVRADGDAGAVSAETLKNAGIDITRAISRYLEAILEADLDHADVPTLVRLQHRTENLRSLYESLDEFVTATKRACTWDSSKSVSDQMIEAMHALLSALTDAVASQDAEDQKLILSMLGHRDELMDRIRRRVLQENPDLPAEAQEALFAVTMLFERVVWLARRCALLILPENAAATTTA